MKDIDRNINSYLYETDNVIFNKININTDVRNNSVVVYSADITAINGATITNPSAILEPGEYYFRHTFFPVESNNDDFFFALYINDLNYPFCTYKQNSPLSGNNISIPCSFNLDKKIKINIAIRKPDTQNYNIRSTINIFRRKN